jgi:hypothetical protein
VARPSDWAAAAGILEQAQRRKRLAAGAWNWSWRNVYAAADARQVGAGCSQAARRLFRGGEPLVKAGGRWATSPGAVGFMIASPLLALSGANARRRCWLRRDGFDKAAVDKALAGRPTAALPVSRQHEGDD